MTATIPRHKVFISFHEQGTKYRDRFVKIMSDSIVDKSVHDDDIYDLNLRVATILQRIRDNFIADATVTVVLIGRSTWQRKNVDWEIGSSIRKTKKNSRCGLLGILLPNHHNFSSDVYKPRLIPPRLADNAGALDPYAEIHRWSGSVHEVNLIRRFIHRAFQRRYGTPPDNSRPQFGRNRSGSSSSGWKD